jgi:membrane complex biogenesis BtpA family protein
MPQPKIIAALHLPPFPGSGHPDAQSLPAIREFALRNTAAAVRAGVRGLYLQDLGDHPVARPIPEHITAGVAAVGAALRAEFPDLYLGICLMGHGAREPLAIAQAIEAQFVRLKVYVGAMIKAEGLLQGCSAEAVQYRRQIGAEDIAIFADVYDRTGEPLGRLPLAEEARQAAVFGRADALVLTGRSFQESLDMVAEVRQAKLSKPVFFGGGVDAANVKTALQAADGAIVSSAFKSISGFTRESMKADWDEGRIKAFMQAAEN